MTTDGLVTEQESTHLDPEGLWIPPELREFERQVVFRTPRLTIQHFSSKSLSPYFGAIDEDHFGDEDTLSRVKNPGLVPNEVSIKLQGEDPVVLEVEIPDGGEI